MRLPDPPLDLDPTLRNYLQRVNRALEARLRDLESADITGYSVTNAPTSGYDTIDASAATLDEVRGFLARIFSDLRRRGRWT